METTKKDLMFQEYIKYAWNYDRKNDILPTEIKNISNKQEQKKKFIEYNKPYFETQYKELEKAYKEGSLLFINMCKDNQKLYYITDNKELYSFNIFFCKCLYSTYNYNKKYFVKYGYGYSLSNQIYCNIATLFKEIEPIKRYREI